MTYICSLVTVTTAGYDQSPAKQATPTSGGMAPASSGEVFSPVSIPVKTEESPTMLLEHQAAQGGVSEECIQITLPWQCWA